MHLLRSAHRSGKTASDEYGFTRTVSVSCQRYYDVFLRSQQGL